MEYTDYCTCFYEETTESVWFWDEINDRKIGEQKTQNENEAKKVMEDWVANAPDNVICQCLD